MAKNKKKKRELALNVLPLIAADKVHEDSIESVCWMTTERLITGSSDHSMKIIDVESLRETRKILTKDSITTGIDYANDRIISSHEDGYLRLWDVRDPINPSATFKSHAKYVSSIKFNRNHNIFASVSIIFILPQGSYDHTVKVWDCRSIFPLQSISTHLEKVMALAWKNESELATGGSDSQVHFHSI